MKSGKSRPNGSRSRRVFPKAKRSRRFAVALRVETLESRSLMASLVGGSFVEIDAGIPNGTLDQAVLLGDLNLTPAVISQGTLGDGPAGNADVEWYTFTLDHATRVVSKLTAGTGDTSFHGVLSLYNSDAFDFSDPYYVDGYRLVQQASWHDPAGAATIDQLLGPGTYYLAVSGLGNAQFHPLIADSGLPGETGGFELSLSASGEAPGPLDGPAVLTSDPAPGAVLHQSPLIVRVELSAPIDLFTAVPGDNVTLTYNPAGSFGDGNDIAVPLLAANVSPAGTELRLILQAALAPGFYQIALAGDNSSGRSVLVGLDGKPLGADSDHPSGQDFTSSFFVDGYEGNTQPGATADDTPATAHDLGDLTSAGIVTYAGAIGDDPFYPDLMFAGGNDVDLYHFKITTPGQYALLAEAFAGRIGSPLDPGISLYRLDPDSGTLVFIAGNNNTYNPTETTDHWYTPLFTDAMLSVALGSGDYYIAVSSGSNTPSPMEYMDPSTSGLFDPNVSHSGQNGFGTGPYVLNLLVHAVSDPPQVLATNPVEGSTFDHPPLKLMVKFDVPVNLPQLAFQTYQASADGALSSVFIVAADGTRYFPRFIDFDYATNLATFLMVDGLPNGAYEIHLSGAAGLEDLAGDPLAGNDPSGDYVVRFSVDGPERGNGDPLVWSDQEPNDDLENPQSLGVLFPRELYQGVTVKRAHSGDPDQAPGDHADFYRFRVLQKRSYGFSLAGAALPPGIKLAIVNQAGERVPLVSVNNGKALLGTLDAGTYVIEAYGWDDSQAASVAYNLVFKLTTSFDNAPPLRTGPEPLIAIRLDSIAPPPPPPVNPPPVTPPVDPPPVTPPVTAPTDPHASDPPSTPTPTPTPSPTSPGGSSSPGFSYGPVGLPLGGLVVPIADGPVAVDPSPPDPVIAPTFSLAVPNSSLTTVVALAPSLGLAGLANGSIGGERGSDGFGMDSNDPAQYAVAVARSVVTTGVIVATISPSWLGGDDRGESIADVPEAAVTIEQASAEPQTRPEAEPAKVASNSARLDELVTWLAGFVPQFLSQREHDLPDATEVAEAPIVVPAAETRDAESLPAPADPVSDSPAAPVHGEVALASSEKAWLVVISATSVAAVAFARRRWARATKTGVRAPRRGFPRPAPGSSLATVLKTISRPSFSRHRCGPQQASVTVRSNAPVGSDRT